MAATKTYWVERAMKLGGETRWHRVIGSQGNRSYALGWFHAVTSYNPRPAYRLLSQAGRGVIDCVEHDPGAGPVTVSVR